MASNQKELRCTRRTTAAVILDRSAALRTLKAVLGNAYKIAVMQVELHKAAVAINPRASRNLVVTGAASVFASPTRSFLPTGSAH